MSTPKTPLFYTMQDIVLGQRSARGLRWESFRQSFYSELEADPEARKRLDKSFDMVRKAVLAGSVHSDTFLTNMAIQYANDAYIGEQLCTLVPVDKRSDKFATFPKRERFEYPDDTLAGDGRTQPNEISESRSSDNYSVRDYGFSNFLAQDTLDNQDPIFNERAELVIAISEGLAFKRELRIAELLTTASNYASGNTTTLSGTNQWSDSNSNPVKNVQDAKAALFRGPGPARTIGFCSLDVLNALLRHPQIVERFKYTAGGPVIRSQLAGLFGLDDLLVGESRKQTANEGQTAAYSRIWGNDFGVLRVGSTPSRRMATFASLFRLRGEPITTEWFDPAGGKSGGYYAKVAVSEDLKVVADSTGYLIKSAIA